MTGAAAVDISPQIRQAIKSASVRTGTGFDYLLDTAIRESGLKSTAKSNSSTATGLFQFVEQTWLKTVQSTGAKYGLAPQAAAITRGPQGRYDVADAKLRAEILALRTDPKIAAMMAGELTRANAGELKSALGRAPSSGELYIGHFLGARGAGRLVNMAASDPNALAATQFPAAARANPAIFNNADGSSRTVRGVYDNLVAKHGASAPVMVAAVAASAPGSRGDGPLSIVPDQAALASQSNRPGQTAAGGDGDRGLARLGGGPMAIPVNFLDLYGTGAGRPANNGAATRLAGLRLYSTPAPVSAPVSAKAPAPQVAPAPATPSRALWGGGLFTVAR